MNSDQRYILQLCHCYYDPFLDCARQYAVLFKDTPYKVITVFMTGEPDPDVAKKACSDEVIFLGHNSKALAGAKLTVIREVKNIARQYPFSACIAHRAKSAYVGLLATNLPIFSVRHSFGDFDRFGRRLMGNLFKSRLTLLAVSNAVRDEIRSHLPDWPEEKIITLYNRIDVDAARQGLFDRREARQKLRLPENSWILGSVGRLHPDKDPQTLIKGFARALPHLPVGALLVMLGDGKLRQTMKALAAELDISDSVLLPGNVIEARRYFSAFDAFALTSDHEPFGMVLLEAMAAELPIICSDCGGGPEVVGDTGELFPFGDADALAEGLIRVSQKQLTEADHRRIFQRLQNHFSDCAVREQFWQLPQVNSTLGKAVAADSEQ
ncbi:MAG: glycosyltransferase involved in cell wall biosynthesis [Porticoccus sp.]|jgi:glycosyltransferase involved in cell wall biosynthesis|uniref:glycosyltransferase n=1 Tax=Porticoccus sp. TaxID=2024853 RepID=UPI0039E6F9D0